MRDNSDFPFNSSPMRMNRSGTNDLRHSQWRVVSGEWCVAAVGESGPVNEGKVGWPVLGQELDALHPEQLRKVPEAQFQ